MDGCGGVVWMRGVDDAVKQDVAALLVEKGRCEEDVE